VTQTHPANLRQDTGLVRSGKELIMPMVNGKKYAYTAAGKKKAKAAAKKTGKKVSYGKGKK
jgi:hypothetical protein